MMSLDDRETLRARASQMQAQELAEMLVEVYNSFLEGATGEQCLGVLTHRGVSNSDALKIHSTITKLTA